jgi:hypothetical protein
VDYDTQNSHDENEGADPRSARGWFYDLINPIMTVGSGLLEGLSWEGLTRFARGRFYDLIGWIVGRFAKSWILRPDSLQLFFFKIWIGTLIGLGSCVCPWLVELALKKSQKNELAPAPHTMHASCRHDRCHACRPTITIPSRSESSHRITAISVALVQRPHTALPISTSSIECE